IQLSPSIKHILDISPSKKRKLRKIRHKEKLKQIKEQEKETVNNEKGTISTDDLNRNLDDVLKYLERDDVKLSDLPNDTHKLIFKLLKLLIEKWSTFDKDNNSDNTKSLDNSKESIKSETESNE